MMEQGPVCEHRPNSSAHWLRALRNLNNKREFCVFVCFGGQVSWGNFIFLTKVGIRGEKHIKFFCNAHPLWRKNSVQ
jgi:hypothetical protein